MTAHLDDPTLIDGRYRLEIELGAGAFGCVYKAIQEVLERPLRDVALKLFHSSAMTADNVQERMSDALQINALLANLTDWEVRQHFVTVYDMGITRDGGRRGFVAMELVRGGNLEARIRDLGKFTLPGTLHYLHQIARAMAYMHASGFVHSDLKPANVLVFRGQERDLIKIGDFGLAGKYLGPFEAGPRGGTLSYLAPECLEGAPSSPASDVYAIGVMAYEMLTGANPFSSVGHSLDPDREDYASALNEMHRVSRRTPLVLTCERFPELQGLSEFGPLLDVVNKMLATRPDQRYVHAGAVFADVQRVLESRPPSLSGGASRGDADAGDPLARDLEAFEYLLTKENWADAAQVAGRIVRAAPQRAIGYLCQARIASRQARQAKQAHQAPLVATLMRQGLARLKRGINACPPMEHATLQREMADFYQQLGDDATANEFRKLAT